MTTDKLGTVVTCKTCGTTADHKDLLSCDCQKCYKCDVIISKEELDENGAYTTDGEPHCPSHYEQEPSIALALHKFLEGHADKGTMLGSDTEINGRNAFMSEFKYNGNSYTVTIQDR